VIEYAVLPLPWGLNAGYQGINAGLSLWHSISSNTEFKSSRMDLSVPTANMEEGYDPEYLEVS